MKTMAVRDARARFSELIDGVAKGEPVTITRNGEPAAVVVSMEEARKLGIVSAPSFLEHLMAFPGGIEFERDTTPLRDLDL